MGYNIFTFPLEQIGWGLRQLSLSGTVGNIFAVFIYLFIGIIPGGIYLILKKQGKLCKMDGLLWVLSVLLLIVLYFLINPGLFVTSVAGSGTYLLCGGFYSLLAGYLVLRVLSASKKADMRALQKGLRTLLYAAIIVFAAMILVELFVNLPTRIAGVREGNSATMGNMLLDTVDLTGTNVFLVLQSVVNALPYGLHIIVLWFCIQVLNELLAGSYSEKAIAAVKKVSDYCRKSLAVIVVSEVALNTAQILFRNSLYQVDITVTIPVFSILFIFAIHMMARYIEENQKLKLDNSLFI